MIITPNFNKYVNALIKEFNKSNLEMCISVESKVLRFIPSTYSFKSLREIFKEVSLFPMIDNKRISFKDIRPKELLECIKRFKEWASINGYEWSDDEAQWQRLYELYK